MRILQAIISWLDKDEDEKLTLQCDESGEEVENTILRKIYYILANHELESKTIVQTNDNLQKSSSTLNRTITNKELLNTLTK